MARSPDLATGPQPDSYVAHVATPGLTRNTTRLPPAGATRPNGEPNGTASALPLQMENLVFLWVGLIILLTLTWVFSTVAKPSSSHCVQSLEHRSTLASSVVAKQPTSFWASLVLNTALRWRAAWWRRGAVACVIQVRPERRPFSQGLECSRLESAGRIAARNGR